MKQKDSNVDNSYVLFLCSSLSSPFQYQHTL